MQIDDARIEVIKAKAREEALEMYLDDRIHQKRVDLVEFVVGTTITHSVAIVFGMVLLRYLGGA